MNGKHNFERQQGHTHKKAQQLTIREPNPARAEPGFELGPITVFQAHPQRQCFTGAIAVEAIFAFYFVERRNPHLLEATLIDGLGIFLYRNHISGAVAEGVRDLIDHNLQLARGIIGIIGRDGVEHETENARIGEHENALHIARLRTVLQQATDIKAERPAIPRPVVALI